MKKQRKVNPTKKSKKRLMYKCQLDDTITATLHDLALHVEHEAKVNKDREHLLLLKKPAKEFEFIV